MTLTTNPHGMVAQCDCKRSHRHSDVREVMYDPTRTSRRGASPTTLHYTQKGESGAVLHERLS